MGLRTFLLFPAIIVFIGFIVAENATIPAGGIGGTTSFYGYPTGQSATNATSYTCGASYWPCFSSQLPTNALITCSSVASVPCKLLSNCNNIPSVTGLYCQYFLWVFPTGTYEDNGVTVYLTANGQATQVSSNGATTASFTYGTFTAGSIILVIVLAVGVAALSGIRVFGSGESSESVHVLFIAGTLLGLWGILSVLEGFIGGNSHSGFAQIDSATGFPLGTGLFIMLTLLYMVGITGAVSRGV